MNAATAIVVLCLAAVVLGEPCPKRPTPFFDCDRGPSGIFFPHPEDCTFLVVCIGNQPVVVSLCEETDYRNVNDPKYSLGCPKECAHIQPTDCEITYQPAFPFPPTADPPTVSPENTHPETPTETEPEVHPEVEETEPQPNYSPVVEETTQFPFPTSTVHTHAPNPPSTPAHPWFHPNVPTPRPFPPPGHTERPHPITAPTQRPIFTAASTQRPYPITVSTQSPNTDPHHLNCQVSGIVVHPYDCMKAFVCPSAGIQAILFNICENISRDSTFPVGCPEMCPGWLPGVNSVSQSPHPYSVAI